MTVEVSIHGDASIDCDVGTLDERVTCLMGNQFACKDLIQRLENGGLSERNNIVDQLLPCLPNLSCDEHACRVVQKAVEVVGGRGRDKLVVALESYMPKLLDSAYGNHVLSKIVEFVPGEQLSTLIVSLSKYGPSFVARHRYGCRIMERLIEHCSAIAVADLMEPVVTDCQALCRHQFGNFVIQRLLENGSLEQRARIIEALSVCVSSLATHRIASHVIQRVLDFSGEGSQTRIVNSLLACKHPCLVDVALNRYGSYVVQQLVNLQPVLVDMVTSCLFARVHELQQTEFGIRVAEAFNLNANVGALQMVAAFDDA